eukprot:gnl/TRDRNA2_/TRDRNA2_136686_c0_seq3.p2 gnl/TRDRNA2_/TRDRNA2_136686_c0~~gnl/TRDRNA2_/TRDRNA2_136686_c0_seq3.p2  ORF type:complete len:168 (+),score=31.11 gnl/TRDRNA2_/TRDRNA2_136686_c0_seq3:128-631(+)
MAPSKKRRRGPAEDISDGPPPGCPGHVPVDEREGLTGTVRVFNPDKGWGFVLADKVDGDIFLHVKHILSKVPQYWIGHQSETKDRDRAAKDPEAVVRCTFDLSWSAQGKMQAMNVRILPTRDHESEDESDKESTTHALVDGERAGDRGSGSPSCWNCASTVAVDLGV